MVLEMDGIMFNTNKKVKQYAKRRIKRKFKKKKE